jgi:hypothetical protein
MTGAEVDAPSPASTRPAGRIHGWSSSTTAAPPTSTGTIFSNVPGGVTSSSPAPVAPPTSASRAYRRSTGAWPVSSGRDPSVAPTDEMVIATVLVTLAVVAGRPTASSAG